MTVVAGQNKTCTLTNTDNTPTLKLVKVVTNNDGGTAVADDWTAVGHRRGAQRRPQLQQRRRLGDLPQRVRRRRPTPWPRTRTRAPATRTTGEWSCTRRHADAGKTSVTVPLGADVTCTITNTDNTPTLKLVKIVTNNDGGTAVAGRLDAVGHRGRAQRRPQLQQRRTARPIFHNVFAGTAYTLAENPNPGTGYSTTGEWS